MSTLAATPLYAEFAGISDSISNGDAASPADTDYPYAIGAPVAISGEVVDNLPIDVVHWTLSGGNVATDGLDWWRRCMTLLVRL